MKRAADVHDPASCPKASGRETCVDVAPDIEFSLLEAGFQKRVREHAIVAERRGTGEVWFYRSPYVMFQNEGERGGPSNAAERLREELSGNPPTEAGEAR